MSAGTGPGSRSERPEVGWSRRRPWSRSRSQIGLLPKCAATLVRFRYAAHRLAADHSVGRVAAACGYVGQSHLHREVTAFTRMTPVTLAGGPGLAVSGIAWAGTWRRRGRRGWAVSPVGGRR
ncbi:helix-turn-helix domain-containing protein [Streptomyces rimosus]|uniref:helix-turn-helix domain-containing protein n=1 Tax=Streptomyces rimosus TaxID=1927 RepID=UPI0037CCE09C